MSAGDQRGEHRSMCERGHDMTPSNVYVNPKSLRRQCRECMRANKRASSERRKLKNYVPPSEPTGKMPYSQHGKSEPWKEKPKDPPAVRARSLVGAIEKQQKKRNPDQDMIAGFRRDIHSLLRQAYGVQVTTGQPLPYTEQENPND